VLHPALLRPGRFDRQVTIPLPTLVERAAILAVHRPELDQLVALLLEHETVDGSAVYRIVGKPVPGRQPRELAPDGSRPAP
jgi:SpoVK/Ycf46/Vps4 family AAA+-type ATPase